MWSPTWQCMQVPLDFQNIPVSPHVMKESLWLLFLYTNLSVCKAIKRFHWLEPLHNPREWPSISSQAWKTWTRIRGLIWNSDFILVPENRHCLSKPAMLINKWEGWAVSPGNWQLTAGRGWGWDKMHKNLLHFKTKRVRTGRKIEKKKNFLLIRSNPTRVRKFKNNCKKILKIKKHQPGFFSRWNRSGKAEK